jgi:hypothetical protein
MVANNLSVAFDKLRSSIALTAEWQSWTGDALAAAKLHVFPGGMEAATAAADALALIDTPRAFIELLGADYILDESGRGNFNRYEYTMLVTVVDDVATPADTLTDRLYAFTDRFGKMLEELPNVTNEMNYSFIQSLRIVSVRETTRGEGDLPTGPHWFGVFEMRIRDVDSK